MVEAEGAYVIGRNIAVSKRLWYLGNYTTLILKKKKKEKVEEISINIIKNCH